MSDNRILYVRDKNTRSIISIQEGYLSLTWTERYQEAGEFVLDLPVTADNIDLYQEGRYISRDDTDESMVIDTIDITESFGDEEKPVLEVKGRTLSSLLTRRVNASRIDDYYKDGFVNYSGTISEVCTGIINDDMISPIKVDYEWFHLDSETGKWVEGYDGDFGAQNEVRPVFSDDPSRAVPNVSVVCDSSLAHIDMDFSFSKFMTIYDILNAISKRYVTGFKVILDKSNNFVVRIYKGSDRTRKNRTLDPIIFDPIMDNISYVNYFNDYTDYKNYWIPGKEGELSNWMDRSWYENPYMIANEVTTANDYNLVNAYVNASYEILPWLKATLRSGADYYGSKTEWKTPIGSSAGWGSKKGYYGIREESGFSINNDLLLMAEKQFGDFSVDGFSQTYNLFDLRYCNWQRDLLHGTIPRAQYGEASVVAVSGNPVVNTTVSSSAFQFLIVRLKYTSRSHLAAKSCVFQFLIVRLK